MSSSSWAVFVIVVVALCAWDLAKRIPKKADAKPPAVPKPPAPVAPRRTGARPHPVAVLTDVPDGVRIIDLRGFPADALANGEIEVARAQLRIARPFAHLMWVVELETARIWAALPAVALANLAARLTDPRRPTASRFLYAMGGQLGDAETAALKAAAFELLLDYKNLSDPPKSVEDLIDLPVQWAPSSEDRPVPPCKQIATQSIGPAIINLVEGFGFIDLRRVDPEEWERRDVLGGFAVAISELLKQPLTHVVWVAAPWVLERVGDKVLPELEALVGSIPPAVEQRLAIVAPQHEPIGDYPLTRRLGKRLRPIGERMQWHTKDHGVFDVAPLDALHDAYFHGAWKKRRKLRSTKREDQDLLA
jgi:hypothetical protein